MRHIEPHTTDPLTMSSLEIASLCGKRHDHVMRDIRYMLESLDEVNAPKFGGVYRDAKNEARPCFHLPKRECLILVSGYDVVMRASIIDRWIELENEKAAQEAAAKAVETEKTAAPDAEPDNRVKVKGYKVDDYTRRPRRTEYEIAYDKALEGVRAFRNQPAALLELIAGLYARVEILENKRR